MKKLIPTLLIPFALAGCATSGQAVKEHHLINTFYVDMPRKEAANIVADMENYCAGGLLEVVHQDLDSINKSVIDTKAKNGIYYSSHVEIDRENNRTKVAFYHLFDNSMTQTMGFAVESWLKNNSHQCVRGF